MSALVISVGFTSCLDDDNIDDQEYGLINLNANKIIEIPSDASHEKSLTLLPEGIKELTIGEVRLAAEDPASEDIVVSLTTANSSEIIGSDLPLFPLNGVTVPASVTIPKGERSVPLIVSVNTALLDSEPQYFAISVASVDKDDYVISGNFGYLKLNLKVKHKYEGRYILSGTMVDYTNSSLIHVTTAFSELYPNDVYTVVLETKNGSTLQLYDEILWGGYTYPIYAGGWSGYGSFCPEFTFDDNDNIIAVSNQYIDPVNTRSAEIDPEGVNKYDPESKSFTVSYWMNQPSVVPTPPYHRSHITETYTFLEDL